MTPWKRYAVIAVVAVLALAGAFSAGRFSAPLKTETVEVEKVVYKNREIEKKVFVQVAAKTETKIVYRDKVTKKDGTVEEHEVEKTDTKEDTKTNTVADKAIESIVYRDREVTKTVTLRPDWRFGVLVGVQYPPPLLPIAGPLVLGVHADRRIVGGLWAGLWIQTGGSFGASVSFEF
jgi:hypothetical protein